MTVEVLQEYFLLWLRLRDLLLELVSAWGPVWARWIAFVVYTSIISLFLTSAFIFAGEYQAALAAITFALTQLIYMQILSTWGGKADQEASV